AFALAKCLCGAADRVYSPRVPRSHHRRERARPAAGPACLRRLLSEISNALGAGQGCAALATRRAARQRRDRRDSPPRRSAPPLRTPRRVTRERSAIGTRFHQNRPAAARRHLLVASPTGFNGSRRVPPPQSRDTVVASSYAAIRNPPDGVSSNDK